MAASFVWSGTKRRRNVVASDAVAGSLLSKILLMSVMFMFIRVISFLVSSPTTSPALQFT